MIWVEDRNVGRRPDELDPRLGEVVGAGGDQASDDEDDDIDGPTSAHERLLPYWLTAEYTTVTATTPETVEVTTVPSA